MAERSNVLSLSDPLHANKLLSTLNEIRKQSQLCDGSVVIGDVEIFVQRNVLAAASPYFRALYRNVPPGAATDSGKVALNMTENLTSGVFELILDYIYTSVIDLCEENIQDILQAADVLLMVDLKRLCCEYLERCISVHNCLGIREFTDCLSCPRVYHTATQFMDEHFLEVSYSEEFLQLPVDKLSQILERDFLTVHVEDAIFDSILRWVRHDVTSRKRYLAHLLSSCLRLNLLDQRFFYDHVIGEELVRSGGLERHVTEARRRMEGLGGLRGYTDVLVVTGGEGPVPSHGYSNGGSREIGIKKDVRCLAINSHSDPRLRFWTDLAPMSQARTGHGLVTAGGCLFALGGRDDAGRILNTGECYDPRTDTWSPIPPMAQARAGFGLVALDDCIYALGGSDGTADPLTSVEAFNVYTRRWQPLPPMNLKRASAAYAVHDKKIYVIGGGVTYKLYESVECFDPVAETWASVAPMKERRYDARAVGFAGDIYVFGGLRRLECPSVLHTSSSGMKFCNSEVYAASRKQWLVLERDPNFCSMSETCHLDTALAHGEEILVVGRLEMGGHVAACHCVRAFHPATNSWRCLAQNHPPHQGSVQAALLKVPTGVFQQIHSRQGGDDVMVSTSQAARAPPRDPVTWDSSAGSPAAAPRGCPYHHSPQV